jgi:hypothetical protein
MVPDGMTLAKFGAFNDVEFDQFLRHEGVIQPTQN